jgi:hypothetical protein
VACCNRPVGVAQRKRTPQEPACSAWDKLPVVGIEYEMAFPFQDVEYFRSGLKLLFVAPPLGLFYDLSRIRQYLCCVHTIPALSVTIVSVAS